MKKRFKALAAVLCTSTVFGAISPVLGAENGGSQAAAQLIELLKAKQIISAQEAARLVGKGEGADLEKTLAGLIGMLRGKALISNDEAVSLQKALVPSAGTDAAQKEVAAAARPEATPLLRDDKGFIERLRGQWVKGGYSGEEFDQMVSEKPDVAATIGRMRVMGAVSGDDADALEREYRSNYLSGAVGQMLEEKEKESLPLVRSAVSADIDEKIGSQFKGQWWKNVKLTGDLRVRYEGDFFDKNNAQIEKLDSNQQPFSPGQLMNTTNDRQRFRIRARLGVIAKVNDDVQAEVSLATGNTTDPVSTNQTLGDSLNKKTITLDKAYLKWSAAKSADVWFGRFPNPFFSTDLVWDPDINFDGFAVTYQPKLSDSFSLFFNGGAFPIQEVELSQHDKWLLGGQAGVRYIQYQNFIAKAAVAYYTFENIQGKMNSSNPANTDNDYTAPLFMQKGNTIFNINSLNGRTAKYAYASKFKELNVNGSFDLGIWHPLHLVVYGDYVKNLGYDAKEVSTLLDPADPVRDAQTTGYQIGLSVGHSDTTDFGTWKIFGSYKYLERDAVVDAFTDSDFNLGGTNAKGWIVGGSFGLAKNVWLSTRWLTANEISQDHELLGPSGPGPLSIDVFHLDLNAKF
ncbi:putative porin [Geobacter pickeringii]|uniref:putative porin n=1 Tax=Geobacter pickeringii TaxID=345632 RepID=UPI00068D9C81|nr:putative porin [Geobacter pickeringii]